MVSAIGLGCMGMSEFYGLRDEAESALAQGEDVIPIPGTKKRSYLEENAAAVNVTLAPEELKHLKRSLHVAQRADCVTPKR